MGGNPNEPARAVDGDGPAMAVAGEGPAESAAHHDRSRTRLADDGSTLSRTPATGGVFTGRRTGDHATDGRR